MQVSLEQGAKICDHGALGYSVARCTHTRKHYPFRGRKQFKPSWFKLFSFSFLRIFSQLLANGSSRNNCSTKILMNFADGVVFNHLMSAQPFVFSTCFKRHSFGQQPNSLYLFVKVFTRMFRRIRSKEIVHFGRTIRFIHMY